MSIQQKKNNSPLDSEVHSGKSTPGQKPKPLPDRVWTAERRGNNSGKSAVQTKKNSILYPPHKNLWKVNKRAPGQNKQTLLRTISHHRTIFGSKLFGRVSFLLAFLDFSLFSVFVVYHMRCIWGCQTLGHAGHNSGRTRAVQWGSWRCSQADTRWRSRRWTWGGSHRRRTPRGGSWTLADLGP